MEEKFQVASEDGPYYAKAYHETKMIGYLLPAEIEDAISKAAKLHPDLELRYEAINQYEPSKESLYEYAKHGTPIPRTAEVISACISTSEIFMDYVILDPVELTPTETKTIKPSQTFTDKQTGLSPDEYVFVEKLTKEYGPLRDAIAKKGLDPEYIVADAWCLGHIGPEYDPKEKLCWPSMYYYDPRVDDLPYARPIEGIHIHISLTQKKIVFFDDSEFHLFPVPGSKETDSHYCKPENLRTDLKPIHIVQPEGPSWKIRDTNHVSWQKWDLQVGFNGKEGATIHGVTYQGRPILHRLSVAEMVVPYGDPRPPHSWKNAFDAGEDGLGRNANALNLGCDCLGVIHYFDGNIANDDGKAKVIKNAICLHEEDHSIAWKHTDWRTGIPKLARNRRLVISFICTIANYEYGFYYHFYLDGTIEVEVKLTGIVSTGTLSYEEQQSIGGRKYGIKLGGCLYTPAHQHFFVARIDFLVDGKKNSIQEWNARVEDDETAYNPKLNAFYYYETPLTSELNAIRDCDAYGGRFWQIFNPNVKNQIGGHTSYKLIPTNSIKPFAPLKQAPHLKRADFLEHQLWVTQYDEEERCPAGEFPNQNPHPDGLSLWTQKDRSLVNEDLVVWHVFGVTHMPRPEDWPVMPVEHCGFRLKPYGFFHVSPALDIPLLSNHHSVMTKTDGSDEKQCASCH